RAPARRALGRRGGRGHDLRRAGALRIRTLPRAAGADPAPGLPLDRGPLRPRVLDRNVRARWLAELPRLLHRGRGAPRSGRALPTAFDRRAGLVALQRPLGGALHLPELAAALGRADRRGERGVVRDRGLAQLRRRLRSDPHRVAPQLRARLAAPRRPLWAAVPP